MARQNPRTTVVSKPGTDRSRNPKSLPDDGDAELASWLGERLRRVALGLSAALIVARAYWPGEPDLKAEAGGGLVWVLAVLVTAGLAIAASLVGGTLRLRWSWTDAAVVALMFLVGLSSGQAHDRRVAINLAWDWAAIGLLYMIVRNLPRTRAESSALAAALAATAVALSVYGFYHIGVEIPETRAMYLANKANALMALGIQPGSPAQMLFEKRLMNSFEPTSTFALANSLAGFLLGPLVLMLAMAWEGLVRRERFGSRISSVVLAAFPTAAVLVCLLLTKSRSAYVGLIVALIILALRERRRVRLRTLALTAAASLVVIAALVFAGLKTGWLDRQVLTESTKSLRYRSEYWIGAWRVITDNSPRAWGPLAFWRTPGFWYGHGPGNFTAPYLKYKVPESSEEIFDPHNLILEVWATAGVVAMLALVSALGLAFWEILSPSTTAAETSADADAHAKPRRPDPDDPPRRAAWLLASGGAGWIAVVLLGRLDLFADPSAGDLLNRWLILGAAWASTRATTADAAAFE